MVASSFNCPPLEILIVVSIAECLKVGSEGFISALNLTEVKS